jgi:acetate kinase
MGFTPVDGLVMATRSGSVDPAAVLWLQTHRGLAPDAVADALERDSGLAGLAGTADLRAVLDRARGGDRDATLAVDVYLHRLRAGIAAMTAALEGLDVLVFTGGAGEHSAEIRGRAAAGLGYLGIGVHEGGNAAARPDCEISAPDATVRTFVVVAREDLEMAHGARTLLGGG